MACAGSPGISRGTMKFTVSAAHSVMPKNSSRRTTWAMLAVSSLLAEVEEHDLPFREHPRRRVHVGVVARRPAREPGGVPLIEGDRLGHRNHGHAVEPDLPDLVQDLVRR